MPEAVAGPVAERVLAAVLRRDADVPTACIAQLPAVAALCAATAPAAATDTARWAVRQLQRPGTAAPRQAALRALLLAKGAALLAALPDDETSALAAGPVGRDLLAHAAAAGAVPACLSACAGSTVADALRSADFERAARMMPQADDASAGDIRAALSAVLQKITTIQTLKRAVATCAAYGARYGEAAAPVFDLLPSKLFDVVPGWTPAAYANERLPDDDDEEDDVDEEKNDEDDDAEDKSDDDGEDGGSDADAAVEAEDEAEGELSTTEALEVASATVEAIAALSGRFPFAAALLPNVARRLEEATCAAEGDAACEGGRPHLSCTLAAINARTNSSSSSSSSSGSAGAGSGETADGGKPASGSASLSSSSMLLDGAVVCELVEDCVADAAGEKGEGRGIALERGTFARHGLLKRMWLKPTAAAGQALVGAAALVRDAAAPSASFTSSSSTRVPSPFANPAKWVTALAHAWRVQEALTPKSRAAMHQLTAALMRHETEAAARAIADAVCDVDLLNPVLGILSSVAAGAGLSAVDRYRLQALAANAVSIALKAAFVRPDGAAPSAEQVAAVGAAVRDAVARDGNAKFRLGPGAAERLWHLLDTSVSAAAVRCALMVLPRLAGDDAAAGGGRSAPQLHPNIIKRLVALRDAGPGGGRVGADHVGCFAEAMRWPCVDAGLARDVAVEAERCVAKAYQLQHLPTNGRLGQRPPQAAPLPTEHVRRLAVALKALRASVAHFAAVFGEAAVGSLDSLRSSTNLVLFDACCACVLRLSTASADGVVELSDALLEVADSISNVRRAEVRTLRASPSAVKVVAEMLRNLHFWVCSRPAKTLTDDIGELEAQAIIAFANKLATIVLAETETPSALLPLLPVIARAPVRPLAKRLPGQGAEVKQRDASRHLRQCAASAKHRLSLLTYLSTWYVCLSNEAAVAAAAREAETEHTGAVPVESQEAVYNLLDIVLALAYSRPLEAPKSGGRRNFLNEPSAVGFDFERLGERASAAGPRAMGDHLATCALAVLALALQRRTVRHVRTWAETLQRSLRAEFDGFVTRQLSPALTQTAIAEVLAHSPSGEHRFEAADLDGDVVVTVSESGKTVTARYTADEVSFAVTFVIPQSYPLNPVTIDKQALAARARVGVSAEQWRSWMMQTCVKLVGGGLTVWQSIAAIAKNIHTKVDGVDPCPICYAVVAPTNHKLPELQCMVCKNAKFHSHCLYEWWGNSGQTSCPMCRSPWFSS